MLTSMLTVFDFQYVNHWKAPTYMLSVEDTSLPGGGLPLKNAIWDAVKPVIEEWTGMEQAPSSMYGIRAYTEGAVLNPHVDRLPLVSSCIVNVAQENLEEDWPLEVYDRHDRAVNVTMEPGDVGTSFSVGSLIGSFLLFFSPLLVFFVFFLLVLYESGTLMHGRPFPLKGKNALYFNVFIHFVSPMNLVCVICSACVSF
jgi:prolyl 4-hydroxylase